MTVSGPATLVGRRARGQTPPRRPLAIAHRGEPIGFRENTLEAVRAALQLGADVIEVDVRLTGDGVPVLHHDATLSRVWRRDARLTDLTIEQLRHLAPQIPTLVEAISALDGTGVPLLIDVTSRSAAAAALDAAEAIGALDHRSSGIGASQAAGARVWFCGDHRALSLVRARGAETTILLTWNGRVGPPSRPVDALAPTFFNPWHRLLRPGQVTRWHDRGILVSAWTVDEPARREQLLDWGVDAIISNRVAPTVLGVAAHWGCGPMASGPAAAIQVLEQRTTGG